MKLNEILNEGPMDYIRGASRELGNKVRNIAQPFKDIHQAGKRSSLESDIYKAVIQLAQTIQRYRSIKSQLTPTTEGVLDYMKGAGRELGNKVSNAIQPFKDIHQAGKRSSLEAELPKLVALSKQQVTQLARLCNRYGDSPRSIFQKAFNDNNVPPGIRAAIMNQLKGLLNMSRDSYKQEVNSQQPNTPERQQGGTAGSTGSAVSARYHNVYR